MPRRSLASLPVLLAAALSGLLAACATPSQTGSSYSADAIRTPQRVQFGVIEAVRPVTIESSRQSGVGTGAGAVAGGVLGSAAASGGRGQALGTIAGAVAGGMLGNRAESGIGRKAGVELTVKIEGGDRFAVVQEAGSENFQPGERVRILTDSRGTVRVAR